MIERIEALIEKAEHVAPFPWLWDGRGVHDKRGRTFLIATPLKEGPFEFTEFVYHARQLLPLMLALARIAKEEQALIGRDDLDEAIEAFDAYAEHLPIDQPIDDRENL